MVANISNIQQVYNTIPSRFIFEDITYDNYQLLTDLHYNHGWRNVIIPEITQFQILGNDYILLDDIVTKLVIDLTPEEIAELNKPKIPEIVTRRQFKIALAVLGYNENDILEGINQLPEPNKTIARISYTESGTFERYSQDLIFVAKSFLNLTDQQIDEVFLTAITL